MRVLYVIQILNSKISLDLFTFPLLGLLVLRKLSQLGISLNAINIECTCCWNENLQIFFKDLENFDLSVIFDNKVFCPCSHCIEMKLLRNLISASVVKLCGVDLQFFLNDTQNRDVFGNQPNI